MTKTIHFRTLRRKTFHGSFPRIAMLLVFTSLFAITIPAQTLIVNNIAGAYPAIELKNMQKMWFSKTKMFMSNNDLGVVDLSLNGMKFTFSSVVSDIGNKYEIPAKCITAYPNPATSMLTIDMRGMQIADGVLSFMSIEGKTIFTLSAKAGSEIRTDISHLPMGIYFCRFKSENVDEIIKIIKQ